MKKDEFLNQLEKRLSALPNQERIKYMYYYDRTLKEKLDTGMDEAQAVSEMGDPDTIWKGIVNESINSEDEQRKAANGSKTVRNLLILIFGFPIWFPLTAAYFSICISVIASVWSAFGVLVFSSAAALIAAFASIPSGAAAILFYVGAALILAALFIIFLVLSLHVTKWIGKLTGWLFKKIRKVMSL